MEASKACTSWIADVGAKYNFAAAFRDPEVPRNWSDLVTVGFGTLWNRFGAPSLLSLQNYVLHTIDNKDFSIGGLTRVLPPRANEIVAIYTMPGRQSLLMFYTEGGYLIGSAAVEVRVVDDRLKFEMFNELRLSLRSFGASVLAAGEELDLGESHIERIRGAPSDVMSMPGFDHVAEFDKLM